MSTDEIIDAVGGMSWFQVMLVVTLLLPKFLIAFSMMIMSFSAAPSEEWWCADTESLSANVTLSNDTLMMCPHRVNVTSCNFVYSQEKHTVVTEWNLLCDKRHLVPTMASVQMGGVLLGCLVAGHVNEAFGRKNVFYLGLLIHAGLNLIAAFSVSWQMFMAMRFVIGIFIGSFLVTIYPYFVEFVGTKWRRLTSCAPIWSLGVCVFALVSWLCPDWSQQHIVLAALHLPFLIGWFFAPESIRWQAVHARIKEAEKTVDVMARYNGREKPANTSTILKKIAEEERELRESGIKYSYVDIYRGCSMTLKSLTFQTMWFLLLMVSYGLAFGVGYLSGNIHLNIFLMAILDAPSAVACFFVVERVGRRRTTFLAGTMVLITSFVVAAISKTVAGSSLRDRLTSSLTILCKVGVEPAVISLQLMTAETYPTAIRGLGYGAANTAARLGGIISPFLFTIGSAENLFPPFMVVGSAMMVFVLLTFTLKETEGLPLQDNSTTSCLKHIVGQERTDPFLDQDDVANEPRQ